MPEDPEHRRPGQVPTQKPAAETGCNTGPWTEFLELLQRRVPPAEIAEQLNVSPSTIAKWTANWTRLWFQIITGDDDRTRTEPGSRPLSGLLLLHYSDRRVAVPSQVITFGASVINETDEVLKNVSLVCRSFTNAEMKNLSYTKRPRPEELILPEMPPGAVREWTFTYRVHCDDASGPYGDLISALGVEATLPGGKRLWDECDSAVSISAADQWPSPRGW